MSVNLTSSLMPQHPASGCSTISWTEAMIATLSTSIPVPAMSYFTGFYHEAPFSAALGTAGTARTRSHLTFLPWLCTAPPEDCVPCVLPHMVCDSGSANGQVLEMVALSYYLLPERKQTLSYLLWFCNVINSDLAFKEENNYRRRRTAYCWDGHRWLLFTAGQGRSTQEGHGYHGVFVIRQSEQKDSSEKSNHEFQDRNSMFRRNLPGLELFF